MMKHVLIAALTVALLSGCTTLKKVTGQQNDTVLPGARENILPPDQQTARDPIVTGQPQMPQQGMAAKPMSPQGTAPLKMPAQNAGDPPCDPNVDLCPEALPPDPLPPPSVAAPVPVKQAMAKKPVAGKPVAGKPVAGKPAVGMADAKPLGVKKPVIIKKKKKKVVVAKPAVPADATAPAVPAVPAVPAPPPPTPPAQ